MSYGVFSDGGMRVVQVRVQAGVQEEKVDAFMRQSEKATSSLCEVQGRTEALQTMLRRRDLSILQMQEEQGRCKVVCDCEAEWRKQMQQLLRATHKASQVQKRLSMHLVEEMETGQRALSESGAQISRYCSADAAPVATHPSATLTDAPARAPFPLPSPISLPFPPVPLRS